MANNRESDQLHRQLFRMIGDQLGNKSTEFDKFKQEINLSNIDKETHGGSAEKLLEMWQTRGEIGLGRYHKLMGLLARTKMVEVRKMVRTQIDKIDDALIAEYQPGFQMGPESKDFTLSSATSVHPPCDHAVATDVHKNILGGEWDREKEFDRTGGTLTKKGSSVELHVPIDAVSKAHIYGKVFTEVNIFCSKFKLRDTEFPVSPIVEFVEDNQVQFDRHLRVKIPIVSQSLSDPNFRVLSISGGGDQVESIPLADASDKEKPDVYYEIRDNNVFVFTKHFSLFFCANCVRNAGFYESFLFGSGILLPTAGRSEVSLRLYVCGSLYYIEDFQKSLRDDERKCGRDLWDRKQILTGIPDQIDTICSSIQPSTQIARGWSLKTRLDGSPLFEIPPQRLCEIQGCVKHVVGEWMLTNEVLDALFECCVDVDQIRVDQRMRRITFGITRGHLGQDQ